MEEFFIQLPDVSNMIHNERLRLHILRSFAPDEQYTKHNNYKMI